MSEPAPPAVSICIPTFRRPAELRAAIESCLAQTYGDFEIVVSDNSEDDRSRAYVEALGDSRVRYFRNERNVGGVRNLAIAVSYARGRYVKLLMDDDMLKPMALERMVAVMERHPSVGVVMGPLDIVDGSGERIRPTFYLLHRKSLLYRYRRTDALVPGLVVLRDFMTREYPCCVPSGLLFRREAFEVLGSFDTNLKFAVDVDICTRFATKYDFYYVDEVLSSWRFSTESDTVTLHATGLRNEEFYELAAKYAEDERVLALFPPEERSSLRRRTYFFATKRCVLSMLAGLKSGKLALIAGAARTMWTRDPYRVNLLLLPFDLAREASRAALSWLR